MAVKEGEYGVEARRCRGFGGTDPTHGGLWFLSSLRMAVICHLICPSLRPRPSTLDLFRDFYQGQAICTMSSRPRRAPKKAAASLPKGVQTGLGSLVEGNESLLAKMLSVSNLPEDASEAQQKLKSALTDCMAMNDLSAEALLARFFDASVLKQYCEDRLGASGKGNEATLAARIARAWAKPDFEPLPLPEPEGKDSNKKSKRGSSDEVVGDEAGASAQKSDKQKESAIKIPKKKKQKVASAEEK